MIGFILASLVMPGYELLPNRPDVANVIAVASAFVALPSVGPFSPSCGRATRSAGSSWSAVPSFILGIFTTEYVGRSVILGWDLPGYQLVDWLGSWSGSLAVALFVVWIPLLFPDGHLPSPRWRPVAWAPRSCLPRSHGRAGHRAERPDRTRRPDRLRWLPAEPDRGQWGAGRARVVWLDAPLLAIFGLLAFASLGLRVRRSRGIERQQLKWFLLAAGFLW